jgi:hypothetical protein
MSIVRKAFTLAVSLGILASCPSRADVLRVDRVELQVPDGGMTPSRLPRSISTFKHRLLDLTITVEVEGAASYEHWKPGCTRGNADPYAQAYQAGTLARTDQYLYSKISRDSKYGISTPRGSWLEYCLLFRSGELAAKMTINLPKSLLEKGDINAEEIEKVLASARLVAASVDDRGTSDPRIVFELPDDIVATGLPTYTFKLEHNRLPLSIGVTLSDPKTYETAKLANRISAMNWQVGSLARSDEYFYYFVRAAAWRLGFRAEDLTAQIDVSIGKSSLDEGTITVGEIERSLASARIMPTRGSDKK